MQKLFFNFTAFEIARYPTISDIPEGIISPEFDKFLESAKSTVDRSTLTQQTSLKPENIIMTKNVSLTHRWLSLSKMSKIGLSTAFFPITIYLFIRGCKYFSK